MPKKIPKKGIPEAHEDLKGFDIRINEFGQIISTMPVDRLNRFLNDNVEDKKLKDLDRHGSEEE
ncbi:MAG: hypothetical protein IPL46_27145 [Saprospiraceae bacterium]|nr:hypothetical protein [Saprospiraceae bacterium]